ncbi:MAG: hypothetical protein PHN74_01060 [Candidatus Pacebacteria bacterium]|nr:hypothetical protein [Candidatus Paceibacterota bacterium]
MSSSIKTVKIVRDQKTEEVSSVRLRTDHGGESYEIIASKKEGIIVVGEKRVPRSVRRRMIAKADAILEMNITDPIDEVPGSESARAGETSPESNAVPA